MPIELTEEKLREIEERACCQEPIRVRCYYIITPDERDALCAAARERVWDRAGMRRATERDIEALGKLIRERDELRRLLGVSEVEWESHCNTLRAKLTRLSQAARAFLKAADRNTDLANALRAALAELGEGEGKS
jgi:hypothetical protein